MGSSTEMRLLRSIFFNVMDIFKIQNFPNLASTGIKDNALTTYESSCNYSNLFFVISITYYTRMLPIVRYLRIGIIIF